MFKRLILQIKSLIYLVLMILIVISMLCIIPCIGHIPLMVLRGEGYFWLLLAGPGILYLRYGPKEFMNP